MVIGTGLAPSPAALNLRILGRRSARCAHLYFRYQTAILVVEALAEIYRRACIGCA
jgi:hypothetical protein